MPFSNKDSISIKEASDLSGYHPDYISALIRKGKISGSRVGRNWTVSRAEIEKYSRKIENPIFPKWKIFFGICAVCAITAGLGFWAATYIGHEQEISSGSVDVLRVEGDSALELVGKSENYQLYEPSAR